MEEIHEDMNTFLSYMAQILKYADSLEERRTEFLEGAYLLNERNETLLLRSRA